MWQQLRETSIRNERAQTSVKQDKTSPSLLLFADVSESRIDMSIPDLAEEGGDQKSRKMKQADVTGHYEIETEEAGYR